MSSTEINQTQVIEIADRISAHNESMDDLFGQISLIVWGMESYWASPASERAITKFGTMKAIAPKERYDVLDKAAKHLKLVVNDNYTNTEIKNASLSEPLADLFK